MHSLNYVYTNVATNENENATYKLIMLKHTFNIFLAKLMDEIEISKI